MKKNILLGILAHSLLLTSGYAGLKAHYTLDETSGSTVADSSSVDTTGTVVGSGGNLSARGVANTAFDSNASAYISTPDGSLGIFGDAPRTISFWFKAASIIKQGRLIGMGDQAPAKSFDITLENSDGGLSIGLRYGNGNYFWSGGGISLGAWHHVVLSYAGGGIDADGTDRTMKLYLDGVMVDRDGGNNSNFGQALLTTDRLALIQRANGNYGADIVMDDVQVYDIALSASDVTFLHDNPGLAVGGSPTQPQINTFSANPANINLGENTTLSWDTLRADFLSIAPDLGAPITNDTGSISVAPTDTTTYILTATNTVGNVTRETTVTVQRPSLPTIESFTATPRYFFSNSATATLTWKTTDADARFIDQSIGEVTGLTSATHDISATTTFTLTATNAAGSTTATVTITKRPAPTKPNLIIFLIDDMGPQDSSVPYILDASGNPKKYNFNNFYKTPNMEKLAASGMRFTTAYAESVCSPTRVGIMTGRNSARHAVTDWLGMNDTGSPTNWREHGMVSSDITLPSLLRQAGYRTIHCGKAHLGTSGREGANPRNLGFDVNIAGRDWGHPHQGYIGTPGYGMPGLEAYDGSDFLTKVLTIEANKALENALTTDQPFFLNMCFYAVHGPFTTNPDATGDYHAAANSKHRKFATMIEGVDIAIGQIRQKLIDLGVAENTFIVFLGDNGSDCRALTQDGLPLSPFNDFPMRGIKGSKWEGGIRIPMIACWGAADSSNPFQQEISIPTNSIETDIVTSWDITATMLDVADVPLAHQYFGEDSHSLVPYLQQQPDYHRPQEIVIHYPHSHRSEFFSLIRKGDMKLIYNYQTNTHQLYNLVDDPTESHDLAAAHPETVMRLARALAQKLDATWDPRFGILKPTIGTSAPPGNVISIPNNSTVDADADGLADIAEDPNLNGLVDPSETDPDNDNTDGDGTSDGGEVRTGTNPLDPSDDFVGQWITEPTGGFTATWPSKPGAFYEIQTTDDLTDWSAPPVATDIPASNSGTTTSYTVPASIDLQRFYRIALLP